MSLPTKINVMRIVTYNVDDEMLEDIVECNELSSKEDVTTEHLLDWIDDWVVEDLASIHNGVIFQDQDGTTLKEW